jgi:hypothetical protein
MKASFEQLGYASVYMSNNLGSVFVFILATAILLLLSVLLSIFGFWCLVTLNAYIKKQLCWNFVIRLTFETCLELTFCVYFNLLHGDCNYEYLGSWMNYYFSILFAILLTATPIFIMSFYHWHFSKLSEDEFAEKFGSVYEGLKPTKRSVISYATYFVVRRGVYALIAIFLYNYVALQIGLSMVITLIAGCYILHYQPFEDPLLNRLEVMNEFFTLLLLSVVFCFTDLFDDAEFQYQVGFVFLAGIVACISVHLSFLVKELVHDIILNVKAWRNKRKLKLNVKAKGRGGNKGLCAVLKRCNVCSAKPDDEEEEEEEDEEEVKSDAPNREQSA